jgi:hypothetical protein
MGQYGAVGFSYGGAAGESGSEGDSGEDSGDGGSDAEEPGEGGEQADGLAANLGIDAFSVLLRRAEREEEAAAAGVSLHKKS